MNETNVLHQCPSCRKMNVSIDSNIAKCSTLFCKFQGQVKPADPLEKVNERINKVEEKLNQQPKPQEQVPVEIKVEVPPQQVSEVKDDMTKMKEEAQTSQTAEQAKPEVPSGTTSAPTKTNSHE